MKNLLYKDFKLVMIVPIYLLLGLFILLTLIPNYPKSATLLYIITFYPMIFLGAQKGTQSNDVYFSLTLPTSRSKIILSRILFLGILHLIILLGMVIFISIGEFGINQNMPADPNAPEIVVGLGFQGLMSLIGFGLLSLGILDAIFIPMFYKTGRNFGIPFTIACLVYGTILSVFTIILPSAVPAFNNIFGVFNPLIQSLTLLFGLLTYIGLHLLAWYLGKKNFEKVDF